MPILQGRESLWVIPPLWLVAGPKTSDEERQDKISSSWADNPVHSNDSGYATPRQAFLNIAGEDLCGRRQLHRHHGIRKTRPATQNGRKRRPTISGSHPRGGGPIQHRGRSQYGRWGGSSQALSEARPLPRRRPFLTIMMKNDRPYTSGVWAKSCKCTVQKVKNIILWFCCTQM